MALHERYRVLVVEDDPDIRRILQLFLTERDFSVATAESASVATELLAQAPVDLILSDVRMPGMSGPELQDRLNELRSTLPIIFLTGYADIPTTVRAIKVATIF